MSIASPSRERRWVEGVVDAAHARRAPLTGLPCAYYELWAYGVLSGRRLDRYVVPTFELVAPSERTIVRAADLHVEADHLPCDRVWLNRRPQPPQVERLLERLDLAQRPWFENRVLQLVEFRVAHGDPVRVYGELSVVVEPTGEGASYRHPPRLPVLVARSLVHAPTP